MKIKFFFLILIIFLCCGCSVEYELNIDNYLNLNEFLSIEAKTEDEKREISSYNSYLPSDIRVDEYGAFSNKLDDVNYYNSVKSANNRLEFDYSFDVDSFNYSMIASSCFKFLSVVDSDNKLVLSTSRGFLCFDNYPELENVSVKITTEREVFSNNADYVEGNTYIWNITEANKDDIYINMSVSSVMKLKKVSFFEKYMLLFVSIGIFVVGLIIYLIFKKRSEKINEI